jgi:hypothetical protein
VLKEDLNAPAFNPVTVKPGKTGTLKLTITPSGHPGDVVHGTLYVDAFSSFLFFGNELLAIPYEYSVG